MNDAAIHSYDILKYFIEDMKLLKDPNNAKPLLLACLNNNLQSVKYLIEKSIFSVEAKDSNGMTAIFYAISLYSIKKSNI